MDRNDDNGWRPQRPLRWYEWLMVLALLVIANGVRAGQVYKCVGDAGSIAYQDLPCAADRREHRIELDQAPALAPSPEDAFDRQTPKRSAGRGRIFAATGRASLRATPGTSAGSARSRNPTRTK